MRSSQPKVVSMSYSALKSYNHFCVPSACCGRNVLMSFEELNTMSSVNYK